MTISSNCLYPVNSEKLSSGAHHIVNWLSTVSSALRKCHTGTSSTLLLGSMITFVNSSLHSNNWFKGTSSSSLSLFPPGKHGMGRLSEWFARKTAPLQDIFVLWWGEGLPFNWDKLSQWYFPGKAYDFAKGISSGSISSQDSESVSTGIISSLTIFIYLSTFSYNLESLWSNSRLLISENPENVESESQSWLASELSTEISIAGVHSNGEAEEILSDLERSKINWFIFEVKWLVNTAVPSGQDRPFTSLLWGSNT